MKVVTTILLAMFSATVWMACSDTSAENRYIDLTTGEAVELVEDEETGLMVNVKTNEPVRMYVDTKTNDTIWGRSGKVINGYIHQNDDGEYIYISATGDDDDSDYKFKRDGAGYKQKVGDEYKVKVEDDGDYKIKNGDKKIKVDAETGERKVKKDD